MFELSIYPILSQHVEWQHQQLKLETVGIHGIWESSAQLHWSFSLGCILWDGHSLPWPHTTLGTAGRKFHIFFPYSDIRQKILSFTWNSGNFRKKSHSLHCSCLHWREKQGKRTETTSDRTSSGYCRSYSTQIKSHCCAVTDGLRLFETKKMDWFWWGRILLLWIVLFKGT